uniref:Uncharacterized protein n=2 Tax=Aegilops tauschii subsp. strangulata TaxID=200361 RepID=A0A453JK92_AEGTS
PRGGARGRGRGGHALRAGAAQVREATVTNSAPATALRDGASSSTPTTSCSDLIWTSCCCSCRLMTRSHGCSLLLLLQPHDLVWCSATKSVFLYLKTPCSVVRCLLAGRSLIIFHPEQEKIISPYHLYMNPKLAVQHYEICAVCKLLWLPSQHPLHQSSSINGQYD